MEEEDRKESERVTSGKKARIESAPLLALKMEKGSHGPRNAGSLEKMEKEID